MLALINEIVLAGAGVEGFVDTVKAYIGPILLLVIGVMSLTFLVRRQISQFLVFILIAIVVSVIFYAPDILTNIAETFAGETKSATGW